MVTTGSLLLDHLISQKRFPVLKDNVQWLNPYDNKDVISICYAFFNLYYEDQNPRDIVLGINPGRLGAGVTGLAFTDPKQLQDLGIPIQVEGPSELSADFIHEVITAFGGYDLFYKQYYISSICPYGFVQNGVNYNYYDSKELTDQVTPMITQHLRKLKKYCRPRRVIILGKGKNAAFLKKWLENNSWFTGLEINILPHPRWILQYRRKDRTLYLQQYLDTLR